MLESNPIMEEKRKLILASASPRRRELLALLGLPFDLRPGTYPEPQKGEQYALEFVRALAVAKGQNVASSPGEIIFSADTIVLIDGKVLGKPADDEDARRTLGILRGRPHDVYTAINLFEVSSGGSRCEVCKTTVHMRQWSDEEQQAYIYKGTYHDKAGGYAIQDDSFHPVERIEGCYANVMGLPLCLLYRMFKEKGLPLPANLPEACQAYTGTSCNYYPDVLHEKVLQKV
ncbi:MAG TPA: Maf family protein [Anaerolineaceae bacterium]|nr:Maf family protein [Anaerolineaceae bacterium]